jgi:steroid delta-isomerase-like uncharacterized protein
MTAYWGDHGTDVVAEDAVYTLMATGEETKGREAIAQMLEYFYSQAFDAGFESATTIFAEDHAVAEGYLVGKHVGEFAGIPATGKDVRVPMCIVYEVADDQVQRARIYFQMASLMRQLGAA